MTLLLVLLFLFEWLMLGIIIMEGEANEHVDLPLLISCNISDILVTEAD
jgi:hypothetical protein